MAGENDQAWAEDIASCISHFEQAVRTLLPFKDQLSDFPDPKKKALEKLLAVTLEKAYHAYSNAAAGRNEERRDSFYDLVSEDLHLVEARRFGNLLLIKTPLPPVKGVGSRHLFSNAISYAIARNVENPRLLFPRNRTVLLEFTFVYPMKAKVIRDNDNHDIKSYIDTILLCLGRSDYALTTQISFRSLQTDLLSEGCYIVVKEPDGVYTTPKTIGKAFSKGSEKP